MIMIMIMLINDNTNYNTNKIMLIIILIIMIFSRDDYECSAPSLDKLVEASLSLGAYGKYEKENYF